MPTRPDRTYPNYAVQRWRVLPSVPVAAQLMLALELPYVARIDLGWWQWFGLEPGEPMAPYQPGDTLRAEEMAAHADGLDGAVERVRYFDPVRKSAGQRANPGSFTIELVRVRIPGQAVAVVKRLAVWLRVTCPTFNNGVPVEFFEGTPLPPTVANGSPFPFPLASAAGGTLDFEWSLVRQRVPDTNEEPAFQAVLGLGVIPADLVLVGPWRDARYMWNSPYTDGNNWVTGTRSILRLFCTTTVVGNDLWSVEFGGRVGGFHQIAGRLGAALDAAIQPQ